MKFLKLFLLLSFVSQLEAGFLPRVALRTGIIRRTMGQQALAIRLKSTKAAPKLSDKVLPKETEDLSSFGEVIPRKNLRQKKQKNSVKTTTTTQDKSKGPGSILLDAQVIAAVTQPLMHAALISAILSWFK